MKESAFTAKTLNPKKSAVQFNPMASTQNPFGGDSKRTLSKKLTQKFDLTKDIAWAGFENTKAANSVGFEKTKVTEKKVKEGTSAGVNWMKIKHNKNMLFQKK